MTWTRQEPKEEGWYWVKIEGRTPIIIAVLDIRGVMQFIIGDGFYLPVHVAKGINILYSSESIPIPEDSPV
jgi:hypothetical protein